MLTGGSGSYGIYIQASSITPGSINANGLCGNGGTGEGKSGGGGGGAVILAYGSGTLGSTSGVSNGGGLFCGSIGTNKNVGGVGGNGAQAFFSYGSNAPITP